MKPKTRADGTILLAGAYGDVVKLYASAVKLGRRRLFLEIRHGYNVFVSPSGKRNKKPILTRRGLGLYLWESPRSAAEKEENKQSLILARSVYSQQEADALRDKEGYLLKQKQGDRDFLAYADNYLREYDKKDVRVIASALRAFRAFLASTDEYCTFTHSLPFKVLSRPMMQEFADYLMKTRKGEGALTIYKRFKKILNHAIDADGLLMRNPCAGVRIIADNSTIRKEILSPAEISQLLAYHHPQQSQEVRRAFIFSLFTGMRFCDVNALTWESVDMPNGVIRYEQSKTAGHSSASSVTIPITPTLLSVLGEPGPRSALVFRLPSYTMCLKCLKRWCKGAGIAKHITWHCARHTYGTGLLADGANIEVVRQLLGHASLEMTQKYLRAVDAQKRAAQNTWSDKFAGLVKN